MVFLVNNPKSQTTNKEAGMKNGHLDLFRPGSLPTTSRRRGGGNREKGRNRKSWPCLQQ